MCVLSVYGSKQMLIKIIEFNGKTARKLQQKRTRKTKIQKRKENKKKKEAKANPKLSGEDLYVYVDEKRHFN